MATDSKIVPQCANCCMPDYSEGICTAFQDPAYQWRNGECWGRCESIDEMIRRLEGMLKHNAERGNAPALLRELRREIDGWRETAAALATE